ncbi:MAG: microcin C ABC transporter permease YejB [Bauldia sp.]|nr:microcin C ABC transporter permease YejB [Bauldia sp.]
MTAYIVRRLLFMIPTLIGIMLVNFGVVQFAPGGPVEQAIAEREGTAVSARVRISGGGVEVVQGPGEGGGAMTGDDTRSRYRGAQGLSQAQYDRLVEQYGFDKPAHVRFFQMLGDYARFDFGESIQNGRPVFAVIWDKMDVSISLGLWMTILAYAIAIPLGIRKAVKDGTRFDTVSSTIIIVGYAIPGFLFAILLIILFAGGTFFNIFPLRGLLSTGWQQFPWYRLVLDYFWHLTLPIIAMAVGAFATSSLLIKNSFLDEIKKQYVTTARAKGLSERRILYGHVFRNAMLLVVASFPAAFVSAFFTGSLLIETIFSLDGLGLLGFESVLNRDYPVIFATLWVFSLAGLVLALISDLTYMWIDPRIDFEARRV